ncbi:Checkpoint protein hus1-like [Gracilariopsis chorda]|uniref:Checkpoint protein n=1 Tax=Gracilariopsis chorda TaxID=448386 RepID=A0A2V3IWG6_9FLOR|nr:Checkpoint protein hus1-like [Gracilariopsis chorda]|eukprot:PXF46435.1 Checkpoint protein hus1-like [Gracilariopsis chorda]
MRFKSRLRPDRVSEFLRVAQLLDKVGKRCVLHLTAPEVDNVRIIFQADVSGSVAAYAHFARSDWFQSYRIESQNANQIGLEMDMQNLLRALRSATAADHILIKLAKKGVPVLAFEMMTPLGPIMQDIPVVVLSAIRLSEYQPPDHDRVSGFALPPLAKIHTLVDRMKVLCNSLHLKAILYDDRAKLSLGIDTDTASISAMFTDLSIASYEDDESHQEQQRSTPIPEVEAVVDLRNFSRCLFGHQAQPLHATCFIHSHYVMVHLTVSSDISISYYIPRKISP